MRALFRRLAARPLRSLLVLVGLAVAGCAGCYGVLLVWNAHCHRQALQALEHRDFERALQYGKQWLRFGPRAEALLLVAQARKRVKPPGLIEGCSFPAIMPGGFPTTRRMSSKEHLHRDRVGVRGVYVDIAVR